MKSVGLVGGLGPESTIDYYRRILAGWSAVAPGSAPRLIIDSLDVQRGLRLVQEDRAALTEYLLDSISRLACAGVDFVALTANTAHLVFDELVPRSPVPLLSIVEACALAAQARGLSRLLLLGTRFTMEGDFYPATFARMGLAVVTPGEADRNWVHSAYVGELLLGNFRDETRTRITDLVGEIRSKAGIDGVVLGGTELPLLLKSPTIAGLPVLDTTALHVTAIVERLRAS